jgi:3-oxoacyl-[acyl-carrier protein] reductase
MTCVRPLVSVVTGAAQGLGASIARALHERGDVVVLADENDDLNRETAAALDPAGEHAVAVALDVRDLAAMQAVADFAVERFGRVDVWVNNAARTVICEFWEITPEEWDDVLAVNLRGVFFGCRVAGEHMRARGEGGRIVNLASVAGQHGRGVSGAHYATSKAGIVGLTRVVAQALAQYRVTVNAIAPAAIEGPSVAALTPDRLEVVTSAIPVGRLGRPEEVAALVAFLTSSDAGYITGATYDINGGMLMR